MKARLNPPEEARRIIEQDRSHLSNQDTILPSWRDEIHRWHVSGHPLHKPSAAPDDEPTSWSPIGPPVIDLIERDENREIPLIYLPALIISLECPDEFIISELQRLLPEYRKKYPVSTHKPGRAALNGRFTPRQLLSWHNYKIHMMFDLLSWRSCLPRGEQELYSHSTLGRWIGLNDRTTTQSIIVMNEAWHSLKALQAQLAAGSEQSMPSIPIETPRKRGRPRQAGRK